MTSPLERKEWKIKDGVIVPYFVNYETQRVLEKILPHNNISLDFLDDMTAGILMPFATLALNREYGGLSVEAYNILGDYLKKNTVADECAFIDHSALEKLTKTTKKNHPFLVFHDIVGDRIYFPSGYTALMSKEHQERCQGQE